MAIGAGNALARIERLAKGVMEFRKLKNDHASLKHPSLVSPCRASNWPRARVIPDTNVVRDSYRGGGGGGPPMLPSLFT